ncbi:kinase-like protein, partial [Russula decolorans]
EESLTSTANEGAGFYSARLGETFDDGRFVITRKLGWGGFSSVWLARDRKYVDNRHVALKILSSYASREIEAGRLRERDILRRVTTAAPRHHGFQHVVHLLHEFTFESFAGEHICFVIDVLSYSVPSLQAQLSDKRLPLKFILRLTKHILKGLEYLHDECEIVHSGILTSLLDLKPSNLLLVPSDIDAIVMHEIAENPSLLYEFPKTVPPNELPFHPVVSTPLLFDLNPSQATRLHWLIADLGHAHLQREHLSDIVQPYALRAPEVILGLKWGPAVDIWSLGCMMYEFATGHWAFTPEATNGLPRDVVHLAQMTQLTGQDHDQAVLEQYAVRNKQHDLKGRRAMVENVGLESIGSKLNESTVYHNGAGEVAAFVRIIRSFLTFDPDKRPRAVEASCDPVFKFIE